ncbi:ADP-ribose diphosphatase [Endozoicomonas sp. (ex Bugula neritina AB1)]|nr:ADP-ribose diphosphatase [Endozoicomonas sp. (ex Bugula neritina AB1)]
MKLSGLGADDVQLDNKETLYQGFLKLYRYTVKHKLFNGGWNTPLLREVIVRPPSVGVILFDPQEDTVVLVEQFRMGSLLSEEDPWMLEVVAGISEPGESLEEVALREVKEESNCDVKELMPVSDFFVSPGACNEKLKLFCGIVDSKGVGGIHGLDEEGEDIKVHVIPFQEAYNMVEDGRIANAPAVIALQWLKLHHHELKGYDKQ